MHIIQGDQKIWLKMFISATLNEFGKKKAGNGQKSENNLLPRNVKQLINC